VTNDSSVSGPGGRPVGELSYTEASRELDEIVAFFEQREVDVDQLVSRLERATAIVDELDRRLRASDSTVKSLAAHPGYAATNLQSAAAPAADRIVMRFTNLIMAQSADMGALPTLYAATEPGLEGGTYIGPDGIGEFRGHPRIVSPSGAARDAEEAARLWDRAEELTDVRFDLGAAAAA